MIKHKNTIWKVLLIVLTASLFYYCGEDSSTDIPSTFTNVTDELAYGWAEYQDGNYRAAIDHFTTVAERDAEVADAYNGLAWSYMRSKDLPSASSQFSFVLSLAKLQGNAELQADAYAGMFLMKYVNSVSGTLSGELSVDNAEALLVTGLQYADSTLKLQSDYSNFHDPDFDAAALKKLMAYSYYSLHRFSESLSFIDEDVLNSITVDTLTEEVNLQSDDDGNVFGIFTGGGVIKVLDIKDKSVVVISGDAATTDYTPTDEEEYFDYYLQEHDRMVFKSVSEYSYPQRTDTLTSFELPSFYNGGGTMLPTPRAGVFQVYSVHLVGDDTELRYWIFEPTTLIPPSFASNYVKLLKDYPYITTGKDFVLTYSFRNYEVTYQRTDDFLELIKVMEAYL
ncbi:FtsK/SpoIIIE N-terminal domain-containing protein [bacterium]|nr:FtsK/SpoIIIE N-terminal domain-containing protein [bacterium]